ncbi:MAG: TIGR03564 family F420-dependent LLM class oxidoreductase [Acidimicrobiales bacterium]|nr:TIGR03564 family F420-dependent LLM class oxidoreductase [Acidimicrobiales bacterium]
MRIGINASGLLLTPDLGAMLEHAQQAEADGFSSWWLAQTGLVDALAVFTAAGAATDTIEMGTAVVPTYMRHPSTVAGQALTAQAALTAGGKPARLVLGIGLSHQPVVEDRLKMHWQKPIGHMRDYLTIVNELVTAGRSAHDGGFFSMHLDSARPSEAAPSVMLAALGPQMLKMAGTHADGTILWMVGPRTIAEHIAPSLSAAADDAGRPAPRVVCSLPIAVTDDESATRDFHAMAFAGYGDLPSYRAMLDREGAEGPGDVCIVGNEAVVNECLDELAAAGTTDFSAVELGITPEDNQRTRALLKARANGAA